MNRSIWRVGVFALVLMFIAVPMTLAVVHGATHTASGAQIPVKDLPWGGAAGIAMAAALPMYAGKQMGNGRAIPMNSSGAPDINALIGQMVDRGLWWYYS